MLCDIWTGPEIPKGHQVQIQTCDTVFTAPTTKWLKKLEIYEIDEINLTGSDKK